MTRITRCAVAVVAVGAVIAAGSGSADGQSPDSAPDPAAVDGTEPEQEPAPEADELSQLRAELDELIEAGVDPEDLGLPAEPTDEDLLALLESETGPAGQPGDSDQGPSPEMASEEEEFYLMLAAWQTLSTGAQHDVCREVLKGMSEAVDAGHYLSEATGGLVTATEGAAFLRTVC